MNGLKIDGTSSSKEPFLRNNPERDERGFGDALTRAVKEVNGLQHAADRSVEQVIEGKLGVHEGMLALGKADTSLRLLLQVRNKVIEGYKEVMRMQF